MIYEVVDDIGLVAKMDEKELFEHIAKDSDSADVGVFNGGKDIFISLPDKLYIASAIVGELSDIPHKSK